MSRSIPHRELRNSSSKVLREVQSGETIEVTNHGEVVAVLVPPERSGIDTLRTRKPVISGGFSTLPRVRREHRVQETLDELRGER
ncbi:MAG: type II toxin-antitoxin system prevent-host-death family antitoxin [Actinomycetota bacterium]|nr:type II toxin-antitoxin system prevent-host-death family antitoxin [Actinomycetota bacterium]